MKGVPPRDSLDFVAALALGAVIGWSVVTLVRTEEEPAASRRTRLVRRRRVKDDANPMLDNLRTELGRVAREAGEQLTESALQRLKQRFLGADGKPES